jgi:nitrogen regulatory protein PII
MAGVVCVSILFVAGCGEPKGHPPTTTPTQSQQQAKPKTQKEILADKRKAVEKQKQARKKMQQQGRSQGSE